MLLFNKGCAILFPSLILHNTTIEGLYMFTFNQIDNTVQWSQEQLKRLG